jgi:outer membrane protein assembly factor BamB
VIWSSEAGSNFGLGAFMKVNEAFFVLNDSGTLHLIEASSEAYRPLAKAKILDGPESWAPMAFADRRLIARDLHKMVCLEVSARPAGTLSSREPRNDGELTKEF